MIMNVLMHGWSLSTIKGVFWDDYPLFSSFAIFVRWGPFKIMVGKEWKISFSIGSTSPCKLTWNFQSLRLHTPWKYVAQHNVKGTNLRYSPCKLDCKIDDKPIRVIWNIPLKSRSHHPILASADWICQIGRHFLTLSRNDKCQFFSLTLTKSCQKQGHTEGSEMFSITL